MGSQIVPNESGNGSVVDEEIPAATTIVIAQDNNNVNNDEQSSHAPAIHLHGRSVGFTGASVIVADSIRLPPVVSRMPNTAFGIPMGFGGHSIMWGNIMISNFLQDGVAYSTMDVMNTTCWWLTLITASIIGICYLYKICTSFGLVKAEWMSETRVHFNNCPNLIFLMLLISLPNHIDVKPRNLRIMWGIAFVYQTIMTYYIYKAWMFSPTRNITEAKPQFLLSTTGWFLLATLGEICKLRREWGIGLSTMCFGAGFLLYIDCVFFIFGRLHENSGLKGSPSMFLLVAAPAIGVVSLILMDILYFAEMLLGWVLILLILLFGIGPTLFQIPSVMGEYWAYVFPLASAATATIRYANVMNTKSTEVLSIIMICIAISSVLIVVVKMCYHVIRTIQRFEQWRDPEFSYSLYREKHRIRLPRGRSINWGIHTKRRRNDGPDD